MCGQVVCEQVVCEQVVGEHAGRREYTTKNKNPTQKCGE